MTEYSRSAKGSFTQVATGNAVAVNLPFQPTLIKLTNYTAYANFVASDIPWATWDITMGQGKAAVGYVGSGPVLQCGIVASQGFSTFSAGISLQYGPSLTITAFTKSSTAPQITTSAVHNLAVGNVVVFQNLYQTSTTGMVQLANIPFVVASIVSTTAFTISFNNNVAGYTALSSPLSGTVKQLLYPNIYAPNVAFIAAVNTSTNVVTTTAPHNFQVGQEVAFRVPPSFGTVELNSLPNTLVPGSPNYYFVSAVTATTFTLSQSLSGYTAFTTNQPFGSAIAGGFTWPQALGVGDANSGSLLSNFLPPLFYNGLSNTLTSSINGPAVSGAFCNNSSQGFIVGAGNASYQGTPDTSSHLSGLTSDVLYWEAYLTDIASP